MKKVTVIFLFLLLVISGFSGILVDERVSSIVVTGKYLQIEIGSDGNISKVTHLLGRAYLFYVNDNDGFDIYASDNQELSESTPTYTILGKKTEKGEYEYLDISFKYPDGTKKIYSFESSQLTTYSFKVKVISQSEVKVALPLIWSTDT
ncbi:MAG: preprotein translocase YidC, partial [Fervidobacterium sp.]